MKLKFKLVRLNFFNFEFHTSEGPYIVAEH